MAKRAKLYREKTNVIIHIFRFISEDLDSITFIDKLFKIGRDYCERFEYNVIGEYIDETPYALYRHPKYDEIRCKFEDVKPLTIITCGFNMGSGYVAYCSLAEIAEIQKKNPPSPRVRKLF